MGLFGRRRRSSTATEGERLITEAILESAQDPRATLFYRQLSEATQLIRSYTADGFTAKPAWTTEDLLVELESHVTATGFVVTTPRVDSRWSSE